MATNKAFQLLFVLLVEENVFLVTGQAMCYFVTLITFVGVLAPMFFLLVFCERAPVRERPFANCANRLPLLVLPQLELFNFENGHFPCITTFTSCFRLLSSTSGSSPSGCSTSGSCRLLSVLFWSLEFVSLFGFGLGLQSW